MQRIHSQDHKCAGGGVCSPGTKCVNGCISGGGRGGLFLGFEDCILCPLPHPPFFFIHDLYNSSNTCLFLKFIYVYLLCFVCARDIEKVLYNLYWLLLKIKYRTDLVFCDEYLKKKLDIKKLLFLKP